MDLFLQQFINALALGGTYALLALGLAVVFSIMGLINFRPWRVDDHRRLCADVSAACTAVPFAISVPLAVLAAALSGGDHGAGRVPTGPERLRRDLAGDQLSPWR